MALPNAARESAHLIDEADVGSGEKTPGQRETDAIVEQIGTPPPAPGKPPVPPPAPPVSGAADERSATDTRQNPPSDAMPRAGAT